MSDERIIKYIRKYLDTDTFVMSGLNAYTIKLINDLNSLDYQNKYTEVYGGAHFFVYILRNNDLFYTIDTSALINKNRRKVTLNIILDDPK
jgi:hypothetical protein